MAYSETVSLARTGMHAAMGGCEPMYHIARAHCHAWSLLLGNGSLAGCHSHSHLRLVAQDVRGSGVQGECREDVRAGHLPRCPH